MLAPVRVARTRKGNRGWQRPAQAHLTAERLARALHLSVMLTGTGSALYTASGARTSSSHPGRAARGCVLNPTLTLSCEKSGKSGGTDCNTAAASGAAVCSPTWTSAGCKGARRCQQAGATRVALGIARLGWIDACAKPPGSRARFGSADSGQQFGALPEASQRTQLQQPFTITTQASSQVYRPLTPMRRQRAGRPAPAPLALGTTPMAKRVCSRPPPAEGQARWRATRGAGAPRVRAAPLAGPGGPAWSSSGCSRTGGLQPDGALLDAPSGPAQGPHAESSTSEFGVACSLPPA